MQCTISAAIARAALVAACLLAAATARPARAGELAVLPPRAGAGLTDLARGATEWVRVRMHEAGLPSGANFSLAAELPVERSRVLPASEALRALGARSGVERAWVLDLDADRGKATVQLAMVEVASGAIAGAGRAQSPLAELGVALATATDAVLAQCGAPGRTSQVPTTSELATWGRVVSLLEAGQLADAWRALGLKPTPTAQALRARIEALGSDASLSLGERARLTIARGEANQARLWLRAQLGSHPNDPVLALAAAEVSEELGELDRALPLYDRALELAPNSAAARQGRARTLVQLARAEEVVAALADPAGLDPAILEQASKLPALDEPARARLHLELGRELGARWDVTAAAESIERAARLSADVEQESMREAALLQVRAGAPDRAREPAERALELGAADAPLLEALGRARQASGDAQGARQAYERARELAPEEPAPVRGLGELALESGDKGAAQELFAKAVELAPANEGSRLMLAGVMRALGNVDGAMAVLEGRPEGATAEMLREAASIRAAQGRADDAAVMLEQAMELAPANASLPQELAKLRESSGDAQAAAALRARAEKIGAGGLAATTASDLGGSAKTGSVAPSGLADLAASFPQRIPGRDQPVQVVALLAPSLAAEPGIVARVLAPRRIALDEVGEEIARALGSRFEVVAPSEIPPELSAAEQEALRAFRDDEATVARMNDALGTDAVFVVRAGPDEGRSGALHLELRMLVGSDPEQVRRFGNQTLIPDGTAQLADWNPVALVVYSLALVVALIPLFRGWGELQVGIQYASLGKGFFSIRISRRPTRVEVGGTSKGSGGKYLRRMRMMGRYERSMVGKETLFRWLPARRYHVTVHGLLQDPATDAVVGNYAAEQTVIVERGKTARLDFDFRAREASLEVSVFSGELPVQNAAVALRGRREGLRYTRSGRTMLYLAPDTYRVLVGVAGRVLEREIAIEGFAPRTLAIDIEDPSARIFDGCPEAVEPYLLGNLLAAADALQEAGLATAAANVRGEHFAAIGDTEQAARAFQSAGRFEEAASLLSQDVDAIEAAELFERAGNHEKAAQAFAAAGEHVRAAQHFEAVYRYEDAVESYRHAGNTEKVCELLEKLARFYEAARTAQECGDPDRAIRNLQMVDLRDTDYVRSCQLLGEIFLERGELDLALQKLDEAVTVAGGETAPLEMVEQLARAYEQAGRSEPALQSWEAIRARDFHYPEAGVRIDALRRAVEADRATRTTVAQGGAPEESRYEILAELGRGGMGVVFKARDKRLGRVVALKRLPDNLRNHPTAVRLFLREARAAAALNHRNIVTLFDAGQEGDQYFLTMELLEGLPLIDILQRRGKLSARDAARLGAQACSGLEYAHAQGIVHRDIKTSNLFFTKDRVLKIMDFGLAKMAEEVRRAQTIVGGTPYYMAPEQAAGEDVDHRADQYALGVTLFELVTGDVPFKQGDVTYHHRHTPAPDPRAAVPDLPDDLAELILRLMAKKREDRFAKTAEIGALLTRIAKRLSDGSGL
jgi:tRNA A-37 threonylcarbamoyl transferase component Bud32/Flp pilus assembly protein TadD